MSAVTRTATTQVINVFMSPPCARMLARVRGLCGRPAFGLPRMLGLGRLASEVFPYPRYQCL